MSFQHFRNFYFAQPFVFQYEVVNRRVWEFGNIQKDKSCHKHDATWNDIGSEKKRALSTIFPTYFSHQCTMMLLTNLAEPDWINVDCESRILSHIFCSVPTGRHYSSVAQDAFNRTCPMYHIFHKKTCLCVQWFQSSKQSALFHVKKNKGKSLFEFDCEKEQFNLARVQENNLINFNCYPRSHHLQNETSKRNPEDLAFLLEAIQSNFPPFLFVQNSSVATQLTFHKHFLKNTYKLHKILLHTASGFLLHTTKPLLASTPEILALCPQGGYISQLHTCDDQIDCQNNNKDEVCCTCFESTENKNTCRIIQITQGYFICGLLYFKTLKGSCEKHVIAHKNETFNHSSLKVGFVCKDGRQICFDMVNDLFPDCTNAEDEPHLHSLLVNNFRKPCEMKSQLSCLEGHSKCFSVSDICNFELDGNGFLFPCRNGGHIESCESMQCNTHFKCENSYCIPWRYVCDRKWDCPRGEDEEYVHICKDENYCKYLYLCKHRHHTCIPVYLVCNTYVDCPLGDDESLCDLANINCPSTCHCLAYAIICTHISSLSLNTIKGPFHYVVLNRSENSDLKMLLDMFPNVLHMQLQQSRISGVCGVVTFGKWKHIHLMDFSFNDVASLNKFCLTSHFSLSHIILDWNRIKYLQSFAIVNVVNLKMISLSDNPLCNFPSNFVVNATQLHTLNILRSQIHNIELDAFDSINVLFILADNEKLCCVVNSTTECSIFFPGFSCVQLLPNSCVQAMFISMSVMVVCLNMFSIIAHIKENETNKAFLFVITAVHTCDLLCVVYLSSMLFSDLHFGKHFVVREAFWRSGTVCKFAHTVVIIHTVNTQFTLIFLSLSRLMVVVKPMTTKLKQTDIVLRAICSFSLLSLAAGFAGTTLLAQIGHLLSRLCTPYFAPTGFHLFSKVYIWFAHISHIITSITILVMHSLLVRELILKAQRLKEMKQDRPSQNTFLFVQLFILTLSNFLCWTPANIVFVFSMFLSNYPSNLVIWTMTVFLPLNAVINPLVLGYASVRKQWRLKFKTKQQVLV